MKTKFTKIFAAIVCSIIFTSANFAQDKTSPSGTAAINGKLEMIDAFGLENECQYRGRMDGFLIRLNENPAVKGYVINYGSRRGGAKSLRARNDLIKERLTFRNFDLNRVEFINGGYLENPATELWISTDDKQKPVPTLIDEEKTGKVTTPKKKSVRQKSKTKTL